MEATWLLMVSQYLLINPEVFVHPTMVDLFDMMLSRMVLV